MSKSVVLCGFMGAGKSLTGWYLAKLLQYEFVDMDEYIEQNEGLSVSLIFEQKGEDYFRKAEAKACEELSLKENTVIAAGGGALTFPENAALLRERCTVVWLQVPLEVIEQRLKDDECRPLYNAETIRPLYEQRQPLYEQAAHLRADGAQDFCASAVDIYSQVKGKKPVRTVTIVGLGLMGGSLAKALSRRGEYCIRGVECHVPTAEAALRDGAVSEIVSPEEGMNADVIVLSLYPRETMDYIEKYATYVKKDALVTDMCGVKGCFGRRFSDMAFSHGFSFIGGHPMAGKERGGYENSSAELFNGASYIITPTDGMNWKNFVFLEAFLKAVGVRVVVALPEEHDEIIAFTSQLPHVLAVAYMQDPLCSKHKGFSAGSYRDVSRVADINVPLWSQLMILNRFPLRDRLSNIIACLTLVEKALDEGDEKTLREILRRGKQIKEEVDSEETNGIG